MSTRKRRRSLWIIALVLTLAAALYQRYTGPTYPFRGSFELGGEQHRYKLIRSGISNEDARIAIPNPGGQLRGALLFKRYKTRDAYKSRPLVAQGQELVAALPRQPAAGKLEYYLELSSPRGELHLPETTAKTIVLRFKDPVPLYFLIPHIALMFLSILVGLRACLGALFAPDSFRAHAWSTLVGMTAGGMILGPIVQKHAFGEYWTGYPHGHDLTDNKTLIMWGVWLLACLAIGLRPRRREGRARLAVIAASAVMLAVYLVPHSLRGSELDWSKIDAGKPPAEAVETGD